MRLFIHSLNIRETTTVKQAENKYTCIDNSDDFEGANTDHSLAQCNGPQLCQYLQLDGSRLLWKGKLELLKDITSELLQKHGKWISPGGAVKRFKSAEGRFEMTWSGVKQQSLTFSGEDGQAMKDKLIAVLTTEELSKTKGQKDILQAEANKNSEGEASTRNINEGDCFGSLSSVVNALRAKMKRFEQNFEDFQSETNRNIDVLFRKSETNSNEQEEMDRLRKENRQIKSDNADLTQRLNNQVHNVADLNTKIKAIEQEKASVLTVIQLLQADCNHPKVDESKECDSWTKSRTANFRRKTSTGRNKESQLNNNITVSNQYAPLMIDESENDEVIESIKIPETSKSLMKTNKSFRNHTQNRTKRKHKQQQNGLKPIQGASVAIIRDSMLKALNPSKLRR